MRLGRVLVLLARCLVFMALCWPLAATAGISAPLPQVAEVPKGYGLVKAKVVAAVATPTAAFQKIHATGTDMYLVKFKVRRVLAEPVNEELPLKKGDRFDIYMTSGPNSALNTGSGAEFIDETRHQLQRGQLFLLPVRYEVSDAIFVLSSLPGSATNIPHFHFP